jgi:LPS sulfotransferase NodH
MKAIFEPPLFLQKNEEEAVTRISENRSAVRTSLLQQFSGTDELRSFLSEFWRRLREDTNLTIVHLVRRDYLSSLYSLKRAFVSDHWAFDPTSTGPGQTSASFSLEPAYCESYFDFMERGMELTRSMSSGHPSLELVFESLCASPREELDRVYEVLGVPPIAEPVVGPTRTSHHERISSFEALRKYFSDTRWSSLFEPSM